MKVLLFDDDQSTVAMLRQSIHWAAYGIDEFVEAYQVSSAKEQLTQGGAVQLMILDIEARGGTGLELLQWVREQHMDAACIFLTSHADFAYAQQAIALGAAGFVLKLSPLPVLEAAIARAMEQVNRQADRQSYYETHQETMHALFWKRLISDPRTPDEVACLAEEMQVDVAITQRYFLCGFALYPQNAEEPGFPTVCQQARARLKQALRRRDPQAEVVFEEGERYLLWGVAAQESLDEAALQETLQDFADETRRRCPQVCCGGVMGRAWRCEQMHQGRLSLKELLTNMVAPASRVLRYDAPAPTRAEDAAPSVEGWQELLQTNRRAELFEKIQRELDRLVQQDALSLPALKSFMTSYMQFVYASLEQYHLSANDVLGEVSAMQERALRSVFDMKKWVSLSLDKVADAIVSANASRTLLDDVYAYICENCYTELSRKEIASRFFLHEDYLSRIFNKRYGMSIPQCITCLRIERAKVLLGAGQSISDVAVAVGYDNFSYFSKIFHKATGVSPAGYRQQAMHRSEMEKK